MKFRIGGTAILLVLDIACKKKEDRKDREINNYGTVTIAVTGTINSHSILITYTNPTYSREKMMAKGQLTDTIHLTPNATEYPMNVSSIDNFGSAVDQKTEFAFATQCGDIKYSFSF